MQYRPQEPVPLEITAVIIAVSNKPECLPLSFTLILVNCLQARLEPTRVAHLMLLHSDVRLLALPANKTLG
jgi:hypothetical protein